MQTHETCDISDYAWAISYVLMATGKGEYADKIERCIFNAGIGSVDEQFKALQYFSCPNQLVLDRTSNHSDFFKSDKWMSYRPNPGTECCAGNVNRFFPIYCSRMWMKRGRDICAVLYGASEVTFGTGVAAVKVTESTEYPFEDEIRFTFSLKKSKKLKFRVRIPGWCETPSIKVNGEDFPIQARNGFAVIEREFSEDDEVKLNLPAKVEVKNYKNDGIYVERGSLVFTYGMRGQRLVDTLEKNQTPEFPAYNIYPDKDWNYTLCTDPEDIKSIKFEKRQINGNPWDIDSTPYTIKVSARKVNGWTLARKNKVNAVHNLYERPWKLDVQKGKFTFTPRFPSKDAIRKNGLGEKEVITLVPMAAAKVRLTIFPKV